MFSHLPSLFEVGVVVCLVLFFRGYRLSSVAVLLLLWALAVPSAIDSEELGMLAFRQLLVFSVSMLCMYIRLDLLIERRVHSRGGGVLTRLVLFLSMVAFVWLFIRYCIEHGPNLQVAAGADAGNAMLVFVAMVLFPLGWLGFMTLCLRLDEAGVCSG